jgi:hypothetical protein
LKVKGNIMLASKLDTVLKSAQSAKPAAAPAAPAAAAKPAGGDVAVAGFASSAVFSEINAGLSGSSAAEREATVKKVKVNYRFRYGPADTVWPLHYLARNKFLLIIST